MEKNVLLRFQQICEILLLNTLGILAFLFTLFMIYCFITEGGL